MNATCGLYIVRTFFEGAFVKSQSGIGQKVKQARALAKPKLSQRELARRMQKAGIDLDASDIAQIESGAKSLNYYHVTVLASILGTTPTKMLS